MLVSKTSANKSAVLTVLYIIDWCPGRWHQPSLPLPMRPVCPGVFLTALSRETGELGVSQKLLAWRRNRKSPKNQYRLTWLGPEWPKMFLKEEMLLCMLPWGCESLPRQSQTLLQPKIVFVFESLSSSPMHFLRFCTWIWAGFAGTQYSPWGIKTCSVNRNEQLVFHKEGLPANKRIFQYVPLKWLLAGKWASLTMEPFIRDACTNFNRNKTFD